MMQRNKDGSRLVVAPPPFTPLFGPFTPLEDLLLYTARHLLAANLPAALRLRQTCKAFREVLRPVREEAEARRLQWLTEESENGEISEDGRSVTMVRDARIDGRYRWPRAATGVLPTEGRTSSFSVRVDESEAGYGYVHVGVRNAAGNEWALDLGSGLLQRRTVDDNGQPLAWNTPPPDGWPDGNFSQVTSRRQGTRLRDCANCAVITVLFDHEEGTLSFRINDGPPLPALSGFPRGASMRACVWLWGDVGDRVSLVRPYLSTRHERIE